MCGIHGILRLSPEAPPVDRSELARTGERLASRGPDGTGEWLSDDGRVALGHRRLAILDLTDAAAQPMVSPDGRYRIVFNGEIYNFRDLRRELEAAGCAFRSTGDTEVVLALYAREGARAFDRLRGMYALAIWDGAEGTLCLARDPFGIKPLYCALDRPGGTLRFASQVRALDAGGGIRDDVDPAGLAGFLLWGSVPEPRTIRRAVRAVPAGTSMVVSAAAGGVAGEPVPIRPDVPEADCDDWIDWPGAIEDSVRAHLVSDVPVAIFLSAGLDSGAIAALACRHLPEPPVTFTLRFEPLLGTARDEGPLAAEVAAVLGTRHVERTVGREELRSLWPQILDAMDQPSIDGFNTYLVSRAAHEAGLAVVLSGLGGDELLGSYPSFTDVPRLHRWGRRVAPAARLPGVSRLWAASVDAAGGRPKLRGLPRHGGSLAGAYFLRRGLFLPEELPGLLGADLAREALEAYDPVADARSRLANLDAEPADPWCSVQALETGLYLRNQLLRDADWASMAHSLELRVPMVDSWLRAGLSPAAWSEARRQGKPEVLRRVAPELPAALFRRPKSGFYIPVMDWVDEPGGPRLDRARSSTRDLGRESRRLALRVLAERGIELPGAEGAARARRVPA
jgi:asparagine synthase (glutamine-hydrolysing)